jgi:hypothetical protein
MVAGVRPLARHTLRILAQSIDAATLLKTHGERDRYRAIEE